MSGIEVGGHLYPQVDGSLIGRADVEWAAFLEEMRAGSKEYGRNNNNAKERIGRVLALMTELHQSIQALPPQGRVVTFSGSGRATTSQRTGGLPRR